jgi:hypothetical protein
MSLLGPDRMLAGREVVDRKQATCINCHQPFKFGKRGDPGVNVYSNDGWREVGISGMCEMCFDEVTADPDEEDESDFCPGCNPEPTISELENGRCYSCGKDLL